VSIVQLDPPGALIIIGTHIVKNIVIVYSLCYQVSVKAHWASYSFCNLFFVLKNEHELTSVSPLYDHYLYMLSVKRKKLMLSKKKMLFG